jgi:hypothetical protein
MGELKRWVVTGTSMVVEAEDWEEAIDRAQETSGWQWEAEEWVDPMPHPEHTECADGCGLDVTHDGPCLDVPGGRVVCSHENICGHNDTELTEESLVRCNDCGRIFTPPEAGVMTQVGWVAPDGINDPSDHPYAEVESQETLRMHLVMEHGVSQEVATLLYGKGGHHLRTIHRIFHWQPEEGD